LPHFGRSRCPKGAGSACVVLVSFWIMACDYVDASMTHRRSHLVGPQLLPFTPLWPEDNPSVRPLRPFSMHCQRLRKQWLCAPLLPLQSRRCAKATGSETPAVLLDVPGVHHTRLRQTDGQSQHKRGVGVEHASLQSPPFPGPSAIDPLVPSGSLSPPFSRTPRLPLRDAARQCGAGSPRDRRSTRRSGEWTLVRPSSAPAPLDTRLPQYEPCTKLQTPVVAHFELSEISLLAGPDEAQFDHVAFQTRVRPGEELFVDNDGTLSDGYIVVDDGYESC